MHASAMLALSLLQARLIDLNLLLKVKQRPESNYPPLSFVLRPN
jgi:hypothetical protein